MTKIKEEMLKVASKKATAPIKPSADLQKVCRPEGSGTIHFKLWIPRILHPSRLSFRSNGNIKSFTDIIQDFKLFSSLDIVIWNSLAYFFGHFTLKHILSSYYMWIKIEDCLYYIRQLLMSFTRAGCNPLVTTARAGTILSGSVFLSACHM